eukprot:TRINITY_DN33220_c0_g1_i1.p1 TRINITY_DN33220_c0_g1~~TRINITY_DN33220_c0_g1_i1.p1  ORF type:complete len:807 (+),score=190.32 TRINITY_DN33220_c0_g1_i1:227-2647(+)
MSETVKVIARLRPLNTKEQNENRQPIVTMKNPTVTIAGGCDAHKTFTFDYSFDIDSTQESVYHAAAQPLVVSALNGFNATIFAYGQTGCGKSFSMQGKPEPPELRGLIPRSFVHIFEEIQVQSESLQFLVRCAYVEIYNEEVRDLLSQGDVSDSLPLKEDPQKGIYVDGLQEVGVKSVTEMLSAMDLGQARRQVGATAMNADSSRSHSIFTVTVESGSFDGAGVKAGKLNLVDLAGSERQGKTGATGKRAKEGIKINLSLSALGNVISALSKGGKGHIPYRDSKLTRLLQSSLGGNTKTTMLIALSPADYNYEETLTTLRYGQRAKDIKNKPTVNEDPKDAMLREFQEEIARLKAQLGAGGGTLVPDAAMEMELQSALEAANQELEDESRARAELEEKFKSLQAKLTSEDADQEAKLLEAKRQLEVEREEMKRKQHELMAEKERLELELQDSQGLEEQVRLLEAQMVTPLKAEMDEVLERSREEVLAAKKQLEAEQEEHDRNMEKLKGKTQYAELELEQARDKLQMLDCDINDLHYEFETQKEDLLDTVRRQERLINWYKDLLQAVKFDADKLDRLRERSSWQDDEEKWEFPSGTRVRDLMRSDALAESRQGDAQSSTAGDWAPSKTTKEKPQSREGSVERPHRVKPSPLALVQQSNRLVGKGKKMSQDNGDMDFFHKPSLAGRDKRGRNADRKLLPQFSMELLDVDEKPGMPPSLVPMTGAIQAPPSPKVMPEPLPVLGGGGGNRDGSASTGKPRKRAGRVSKVLHSLSKKLTVPKLPNLFGGSTRPSSRGDRSTSRGHQVMPTS